MFHICFFLIQAHEKPDIAQQILYLATTNNSTKLTPGQSNPVETKSMEATTP